MLWHRRLGHISIHKIKKFVKDGVLSTLDYTDLEICLDCIKGKHINKSKKNDNRSSNILKIIHAKQVFKAEVENQCRKNGQAPSPFAQFLQEHGIISQYSMHNSSDKNGAAKRRNRTLVHMEQSMLSKSNLPKFLWIGALKT